jgi:ligand-binding sensor domain-containing protein/serine phosphatase RsbU (regulator of sigma subunit)
MNIKYNLNKMIRQTRRIIFFLCAVASISNNVLAQTYYFDTYSVAEGLNQSYVYGILQDKEHYIWLGTMGGASRFDGKVFENFTSQNGLAQNGVNAMYKDSKGIIWLGHIGGGISRIVDNKPEVYLASGALIKADIIDIAEDSQHRLWVTTFGEGALVISNPYDKPKNIKYEQYKGKSLSDRVYKITATKDGSLYFITDVGIKKFNSKNNTFETYHPDGLTNYWPVQCFFEDSKGNQWFGTFHGGLYLLEAKSKQFKIFDIRDGLASNWITTIAEDSYGNVWLGSWGGGLTVINNGQLKIYNSSNGLPDNNIRCITEDAEGNILLGTKEHGLCIFKGEQFISYSTNNGLVNQQVWAITQDINNKMWFGTNGGISVLDQTKNQFINYTQENKSISNQPRFFINDNQRNIWIGTYDQGVSEFLIKQNRFSYQAFVNSYMPSNLIVTAMAVDKDNTLWVGTVEGLVKYNTKTMEGIRLTNINGLAGNDISALYVDKNNTLWVGSRGKGLTSIKDTTFKKHALDEGITPECIAQDNNGNLWIGTGGQGVLVFSNGEIVKRYTEVDGLLANLINLIVIDKYNKVYIGTNKGLNVYSPTENKFYTFTKKNGFAGIETKKNAGYIDNEGNLWFGTVNGVIKYNPKLHKTNNLEPLTHIARFRVNLKDVSMDNGMKLSYKENAIIIDYHSICLINPDAVKYQVMLEGADANWQPVTEQTMVTYSALSPNRYTFKVRAKNSDGVWNSQPVTFSFQINPPFYRTWWFISLCIIIGAIIIITYIKRREQQLVEEKRILEEKVKERTHEVTLKNDELAMKNKNITDSIHYAKRIQFAILPPNIPFDNTFILFKPKDIVSGDFYWLHTEGDMEFVAAVDCTGHGVPGAFMSIIGHILLNKIVKEYKIYKPSEILNKLNQELTETLHSQGESVNDGMDLALCCYEPKKNLLQYAGAFNSLYHVRNCELTEYKANRFSIGRLTGPDLVFQNNEIVIEPNDTMYIFSDGYEDQFGGDKGKKFKSKSMKELFVKICGLKADEQKNEIDKCFEQWRMDLEQVDDVLIIGRKF